MAETEESERILAMICHISILFSGIIVPLVLFFTSKSDFLKQNAKNGLNWSISGIIYFSASFILSLFLIVSLGRSIIFVYLLSLLF